MDMPSGMPRQNETCRCVVQSFDVRSDTTFHTSHHSRTFAPKNSQYAAMTTDTCPGHRVVRALSSAPTDPGYTVMAYVVMA